MGGGAIGLAHEGFEILIVARQSGEDVGGELVGQHDEHFRAEGIGKELEESGRQDRAGHEGLGGFQRRVFDDFLAVAHVAGLDPGEVAGRIGARFGKEFFPADFQGREGIFGEGSEFVGAAQAAGEFRRFRLGNRRGDGGVHEFRLQPDAPITFLRWRLCPAEGAEHGEEREKNFPAQAFRSPLPVMITFLEGTLVEALPTHVVVGVNGVGYHVFIPLSSFDRLPPVGAQIKILTHLQVREDAHVLYGFMSAPERDLFRLLVNHVSGIGPKTALDVLSGITVSNFKAAVVDGNAGLLSQVKGIGKKTAERIIVELKDKLGVAAAWEAASAANAPTPLEAQAADAMAALIALEYKQLDAHRAVRQVIEKNGATNSEEIVRQALKLLIK